MPPQQANYIKISNCPKEEEEKKEWIVMVTMACRQEEAGAV